MQYVVSFPFPPPPSKTGSSYKITDADNDVRRGRCNSDDQFASFESDSELSADLTRFDWIKDAESFICMEEREVAH